MEQQIFRNKSMERISSPEQLKDYMHVTNPSIWIVMGAIIFLLICILIWSSFAVIENQAVGTASIQSGVMTLHFNNPEESANIETGMTIQVGGINTPITYLGTSPDGLMIAGADISLPDGNYPFLITYQITKVIKLLFN